MKKAENKTKAQLVQEIRQLRRRLKKEQTSESEFDETQSRLRDAETRYDKLFETANDAIFIADALTGIILDANRKAEELIGLPADEIIGMRQTELHPEEDSEYYRKLFMEHTETGKLISGIHYVSHRDGRKIPVEISTSTFYHRGKKIIQGIFRDVSGRKRVEDELKKLSEQLEKRVEERTNQYLTVNKRLEEEIAARKRTEKELSESEARYRALFEQGAVPIMLIDPVTWNILDFNDVIYKKLGYNRSEFERLTISDFMQAEAGEDIGRHLNNVLRDGANTFETRYIKKNGEICEFLVNSRKLKLGGKDVLQCICSDITEHKRVLEDLGRFRAAIDSSGDFIFLIEPESMRFIDFNRAVLDKLGYGRDELFAMGPDGLMPEISREAFRGILKEFIESGKEADEAVSDYRCKDGGEFPVELRFSAFRQEDGQTVVIVIARDIAKRKQTEEELRRAKEIADSASRAKSDFLANFSHEIRSPLQTIIGMNELLWSTPLTEEQRDYVKSSIAAGDNLIGLVNNVLDLSKIEAGEIELEEVDFDLSEEILKTVNTFTHRARKKKIGLSCNISPEVPVLLRGDATRLRQILTNLIDNAVKFTYHGGVTLEVGKTEAVRPVGEEERCALLFSIKDTGIGIPADKRDAIFNSFVQADTSIARLHGGTGLGTAISKKLVELMGGRIWVESETGKGSIFYVILDFALQAGLREEEAAWKIAGKQKKAATEPVEEATAVTRPLRILLVEDTEDIVLLIKSFLKNTNYTLDTAENGERGFERFASQKYDLVIMDLQMPVMDGYDAARKMRRWEKENNIEPIPLIAMTGHALKEDIRKSLDAGFNAHVTKPVKKQAILKAIAEHTKQGDAMADVAGSGR